MDINMFPARSCSLACVFIIIPLICYSRSWFFPLMSLRYTLCFSYPSFHVIITWPYYCILSWKDGWLVCPFPICILIIWYLNFKSRSRVSRTIVHIREVDWILTFESRVPAYIIPYLKHGLGSKFSWPPFFWRRHWFLGADRQNIYFLIFGHLILRDAAFAYVLLLRK